MLKNLLIVLLSSAIGTQAIKGEVNAKELVDFESASDGSSSTSDRVAFYVNKLRNSDHQVCGFGPWGLQIDSVEDTSSSSSSSSSSPSDADVKDDLLQYVDTYYTPVIFDLSVPENHVLYSCETREAAIEQCVETVLPALHDSDTFFSFNVAHKNYEHETAEHVVIYNMKCNDKFYANEPDCVNFVECAAGTGYNSAVTFEEFCACLTPPATFEATLMADTFIDSGPVNPDRKRGDKMAGCGFAGLRDPAPTAPKGGGRKRLVSYNGCGEPSGDNFGGANAALVATLEGENRQTFTLLSFDNIVPEGATITFANLTGYVFGAPPPPNQNNLPFDVELEVRELLDDFAEGDCDFEGACDYVFLPGATFECANDTLPNGMLDGCDDPSEAWSVDWPLLETPNEENAPVGAESASATATIPANDFPMPLEQVSFDVTEILQNAQSLDDGTINFVIYKVGGEKGVFFGTKDGAPPADEAFELSIEYY